MTLSVFVFVVAIGVHKGFKSGQICVELRPDLAPIMVDNFLKLCRGLKNGRGYKGSQVKSSKG